MRKLLAVALVCLLSVPAMGQTFQQLVGNVPVKPVKAGQLESPFMTWGGDVPFFVAAGTPGQPNFATQRGSIYGNLGVDIKFYRENEFHKQVQAYLSGRTPFLRCTYSMLGPASEILGNDPRTKPVVFMFVSWSAGDHLISRDNVKTLNDLKRSKKVKIAVQQGGAHVGWLFDVLNTVGMTKDDVEIVWCKEMVGPDSPPDLFRKDASVDACFAISPDMVGLTSGVDKTGTGAEGTVKGAHVLLSTQQMTHAIPDVMVCRSDYYHANKAVVEKVAAGYIKASEDLVAMRKQFEDTKKMPPQYAAVLKFTQDAFGKDMIPDIAVDGHGLMLDCVFAGMPGQVAFFQDRLSGFDAQMKIALDMAQSFGYVKTRRGFEPSDLDWQKVATLAGVKYVVPDLSKPKINAEALNISPTDQLDDKTIYSFTINFEPNQEAFSLDRYGADFQRALEAAAKFGGAVVVVRGHADPTQTLVAFLKAGMAKGVIKRTGSPGNYQYYLDGKPLDFNQAQKINALIQAGSFDGVDPNPKETMQAAMDLSLKRSQAVRNAVVQLAKQQNVPLDLSQIQPVGAGILEPVIAKPKNMDEAKQNMRVEFRIIRVPAEAQKLEDFQY